MLRPLRSLVICLATMFAILIAPIAHAHEGGKANAGYVGDMSGHIVLDGSGNCLRTSIFDAAKHGLAECGQDGAKPAPMKSADTVAPARAQQAPAEPAPASAPAPVSAPESAPVAATPATPNVPGLSSVSAQVLFDFDSDAIRAGATDTLEALLAKARANGDIAEVRLDGHTDSAGSDGYNQGLSKRRAASVARYLADHGVAAGALSEQGHGESQPVADNASAQGRQRNRRVEITIILR